MDFGPHAGFIWAAYLIVAAGLSLLVAWLVIDERRLRRLLDQLEAWRAPALRPGQSVAS